MTIELEKKEEKHELRRLEKAALDFSSLRTQMVLSTLLILISCLVNYWPTLKTGFLLDDFLHVDYCARAHAGDWQSFLGNFTGNWGGSDLMVSYRPLISLSIFADYLLYRTQPWGYHLSNILIFAGCSILVSFLTLELTKHAAPRLSSTLALFAGLLFSVYPLHVETVAWIIGRVDSVATFFYLASLLYFLRHFQHQERKFHILSLVTFVAALTSKEIAVSLPLAIFILAYTRPQKAGQGALQHLIFAVKSTIPYVATLILFALFRHCLLGTTVGGYGSRSFNLVELVNVFLNKDSLLKLFVPVSEEYRYVNTAIKPAVAPVMALAALLFARLIFARAGKNKGKIKLSPAMFTIPLLMVWCIGALLPAFQIWHIFPNLVGSRLFFLSSVPFCMVLALKALPAQGPIESGHLKKWCVAGLFLVSLLFIIWTNLLAVNLQAWIDASARMKIFKHELQQLLVERDKTVPGGTIILANMPQDYKGAGMVGRRQYLDILLTPPLVTKDLRHRIVTIESKGLYYDPIALKKALEHRAPIYFFDKESGHFQLEKPTAPAAEKSLYFSLATNDRKILDQDFPEISKVDGTRWHEENPEKALVVLYQDHAVLKSGNKEDLVLPMPGFAFPSLSLRDNIYLTLKGPALAKEAQAPLRVAVRDRNGHINEDLPLEKVDDNTYKILLSGLTADGVPDRSTAGISIIINKGQRPVELSSVKIGPSKISGENN